MSFTDPRSRRKARKGSVPSYYDALAKSLDIRPIPATDDNLYPSPVSPEFSPHHLPYAGISSADDEENDDFLENSEKYRE